MAKTTLGESDPVMAVEMEMLPEVKVLFKLKLSKANINNLLAGCPEFGYLQGQAKNGTWIYLFPQNPDGGISSFTPMPGGYHAYLGWHSPTLPMHPSREEFNRNAQQSYRNMEDMLKEISKNRIPIEENTLKGKITMGYVEINIKKDK